MSKRRSLKKGRELREKELELQKLQREGKPLPKSNRRQKKYLLQVKKQKGFFKYLAERHRLHDHEKEAKKFEDMID